MPKRPKPVKETKRIWFMQPTGWTIGLDSIPWTTKIEVESVEQICDVFLARKVEKEVEKTTTVDSGGTYTVKSGDSLWKIAQKYGTSTAEILDADSGLDSSNMNNLSIGQSITLPDGVSVTNTTTEKEITYEKLSSGDIGDKVFLIVNTVDLRGKKITIKIYENEQLLHTSDEPLKILVENKEISEIEVTVPGSDDQVIQEIQLRPKLKADLEKWKTNLEPEEEGKETKKTKLWIQARTEGDDNEHDDYFYGESDSTFFELGNCSCKPKITPEMLLEIFPDAKEQRRKDVANALNKHRCEFEINNLNRLAHFLGQIGTETNQLNQLQENYKYSAKNIYNTFLKKVLITHPDKEDKYTYKYHDLIEGYDATLECEYTSPTTNSQKNYGHKRDVENPIEVTKPADDWATFKETYSIKSEYVKSTKLFDYVYGCRMGNGKYSTEDGSDYFGVGFIHLTGKNKYKALDDKWKVKYPDEPKDFMGDDISLLKTDVDVAMRASMIIWAEVQSGTNAEADKGIENKHITAVTKDVNGGTNGLSDRKKYTKKAHEVLKKHF